MATAGSGATEGGNGLGGGGEVRESTAAAAMDTVGSGGSDSSSDEVGDGGCGTTPPDVRVRTAGKVSTVRELWCAKADAAYPSAESAGRLVTATLEEWWGGRDELSGPPVDVRVQSREDRFTSAASGLVAVLRRPFDGWEAQSLTKIKERAWQVCASLEDCIVVKTFGKGSNHAREINWLLAAIEKFLEAGGALSKSWEEIKLGYSILRSTVARDNGNEWQGAVYGVNLDMDELYRVVEWAGAMVAEKKWALNPELRVEAEKKRVVSTSAVADAPGFSFRSADNVMGTASVLIEGALEVSDFDFGESDEIPGLEILFCALGEKLIFDVEPSARGLAVKGVVRVRIRCALRHEKLLRSKIKKLVRATAEAQKQMVFETSEGPIEVAFHSLHTLRRLEAADGEGGGGSARGRLSLAEKEEQRRKDAMLEDLQAHQIRSAAALDRVISQVEKLAIHHEQLSVHHERAQEHAKQVHASLAAEQAAALGTVNQLASIFTSFLARERDAPLRLSEGQAGPSAAGSRCAPRMGEAPARHALPLQDLSIHGCWPPHRVLQLHVAARGRGDAAGGVTDGTGGEGRARGVCCKETEDAAVLGPTVAAGGSALARAADVRLKGWAGEETSLEKTAVPAPQRTHTGSSRVRRESVREFGYGAGIVRGQLRVQVIVFSKVFPSFTNWSSSLLRRSIYEGSVFNRELRWILSQRGGAVAWARMEAGRVRVYAGRTGGGEGQSTKEGERGGGSKRISGGGGRGGVVTAGAQETWSDGPTSSAILEVSPWCEGGDETLVLRTRTGEGNSVLAHSGASHSGAVGRGAAAVGCWRRLWGGWLLFGGSVALLASSAACFHAQDINKREGRCKGAWYLGCSSQRGQEAGDVARGWTRSGVCLGAVEEGGSSAGATSHTGAGPMRCGQDAATPGGRAAQSSGLERLHQAWCMGEDTGWCSFGEGASRPTGQFRQRESWASETHTSRAASYCRFDAGGGKQTLDQPSAQCVSGDGVLQRRAGQAHGGLETPQGSYPHHQSRVEVGAGQAESKGGAVRGSSRCSGLGVTHGGASGGVPPDPYRPSGGVGECGEEHNGTGCSSRRGDLSHSQPLDVAVERREQLWVGASVHVADVWHRHGGGGGGRRQQWPLELRARRGGQRNGGSGAAGGMGGEAEGCGAKCIGAGGCEGGLSGCWTGGPIHDQFEMCAVVVGEYSPAGVQGSAGAAGACARRKPGFAGVGDGGAAASDHIGVCGGLASSMHEAALGEITRHHRKPCGMEVGQTGDLLAANASGMDAKEARVDSGHATGHPCFIERRAAVDSTCGSGVRGRLKRADILVLAAQLVEKNWQLTGTVKTAGAAHAQASDVCVGSAGRLRLRGGGPALGVKEGRPDGERIEGPAASVDSRQDVETRGCCLFWNARQLWVPEELGRERSKERAKAARGKLDFLEHQLTWHEPWLLALLEVAGDVGRMRALRHWLRRRGYGHMVYLLGEGSSRDERQGDNSETAHSHTNGIVLAARSDLAILSAKRLAFRTFAVQTWHKAAHRQINLALIHGASSERGPGSLGFDTGGEGAFSQQLHAAASWCSSRQGVILMDANRTPCRQWRSPAAAGLSHGDRALRALSGWRCNCCASWRDSEESAGAQLVGAQLDAGGAPIWTRWGSGGEEGTSKSRLDVGISFTGSVVRWRDVARVEPWLVDAAGSRVSDHALLAYYIEVAGVGNKGEARPLPVRLGSRPRLDQLDDPTFAWVQLTRLTGEERFLRKLQEVGDRACTEQQSKVHAMVPLLRSAGEKAVCLARRAAEEARQSARARQRFDDNGERFTWRHRLTVAVACAKGKIACGLREWKTLFHKKTGLGWLCPRFTQADIEGIDWTKVVSRCRRQIARAERFLAKKRTHEDAWLADKCRTIEEQVGDGDLAAHVRTVWRMVGNKGGASTQISELHVGDKKEAPVLGVDDPDFLREAGRIGEAFVKDMDRGAVPEAFAAWLEIFCTRFDAVAGDEGAWTLKNDFTYEVFERTLQTMQGKAVGAGGLSVELLSAAVPEVRWAFFQAILSDIERGRIASSWRRVIYVLLRKPPPNDPAIISQRREIALMPQDLKILLQGVRWSTYSKIARRLDEAQYGWKKGVGCADPSLAVACVLDQARRLNHSVWLLYIDLANFFPAINRKIACASELLVGLPEEVARILGQIYGGQQGEPTHVSCQYETYAGLGAPFQNGVGRLMGCPISPDSAKILLNSVLLAIKASVSGVHLWPFNGDRVEQLAYADDWLGLFDDVAQLKKALAIWLTWAEIVGARLGVKGFLKTVVSGVTYARGKPRTPADPQLRNLEGVRIPLLPCDELYKHLGVPRSACADSFRSWTGHKSVCGIRDKLRAGISRLRQLRPGRTSTEQFICISNVLLGGLGGFYLQSVAVAEESWRCWRGSGGVSKLLGDVQASPAQAAVRSAVALSLFSWGCRCDPNRWDWTHLRDALRATIRRKGPRFIGDAWMLASSMLEEGRVPEASREYRAEHLRVMKLGRWWGWEELDHARGGPLHPSASWHRRISKTLFDPREYGGLGMEPRLLLLQAGVVELSQLCSTPFLADGGEGRWMLDRKQVTQRFPRLNTASGWGQWVAIVGILQGRGVRPVKPETAAVAALRRYPGASGGIRKGELTEILALARSLRRVRLGLEPSSSVDVHRRQLGTIGIIRDPNTPSGEGDADTRSKTWIGCCLEGVASERIIQWGRLSVRDWPAALHDSWTQQAACLRSAVAFRPGDGWPIWGDSGEEVTEEELWRLPAAPQLAVRARLRLGRDAKVIAEGFGEKLEGVRVAEDVQRHNWECLCHLQARLQFSHAFATDASEGEIPFEPGTGFIDAWGWPRRRTAAVAVEHSGAVVGGCINDDMPSDSYVGELTALIEAMEGTPEGASVLVILDSTSPVRAWLRFRCKGERAKMQYTACILLEALERAVRRHDKVYFLWQRSHCGSPVNEWADREAERIRLQGLPVLEYQRRPQGVFSLWPARCQGALFRWAIAASEKAAHAQMRLRYRSDGCHAYDDDWDLGRFQGEMGAAASLLRDDRLMVADAGHVLGVREREQACGEGCCNGCTGQRGTWHHYAFRCAHPKLWILRRSWSGWLLENRETFDRLHLNKQVEALVGCLREREAVAVRGENKAGLLEVRRLLCGFVTKEEAGYTSQAAAKAAVREMVCGGLQLLCTAVKLESTVRREVETGIRNNNLLRRSMRGWRRVVDHSGPFRVAALRQIRHIRWALVVVGEAGVAEGRMTLPERGILMRRVLAALKTAREEIDEGCPPVGEEALVLWCIQMKWWGHWAEKECPLPRRCWEAWTPALDAAMNAISAWDKDLFSLTLRWRETAYEELQWFGELQHIQVRFAQSYRAFWRLGGARRLRRLCKSMRRDNEDRKWQALGDRLNTFLQLGTCSGEPQISIPPEQRIVVVIEPRVRKRHRTWERERAWRAGNVADKRGRWAVEGIQEVRRTLQGKGWEVKVAWAGPFDDEWVRLRDLSSDLQEEAWVQIQETWGLSEEEESSRAPGAGRGRRGAGVAGPEWSRPQGVRKSPRLVEAETLRNKLAHAVVVFQASPEEPGVVIQGAARSGKGIKKAWGVHSRGKTKYVYVERWLRGDWKASVLQLSKLPGAIQDRIAKYGRYDRSRDGDSSSMNLC